MRSAILVFLLLVVRLIYGQADSVWSSTPDFQLSGFLDIFYAYDFNQPPGNARQPFFFNHNRHNEFNLNLGLIELTMEHSKYRATLALQTGVYANDNYAAEPGLLKNIFAANIGVALNQDNSLWLDAGVLPSPIGFESAISTDNPTLTRSILAENSPYFLTGAKLSYTPNTRWEFAGLISNGWQRIQRVAGNSLPAFTTQIIYTPTNDLLFNWTTFIGTDDPDATRRMRYFNNFYAQIEMESNLRFTAGLDVGYQERSKDSNEYDLWFSPILIGQYDINSNWQTAIRIEYYQDESGIIVPTNTPNGFQTTGISVNLDYHPNPLLACRIEGRWLSSQDRIFITDSSFSDRNFVLAASLAVKFGGEDD
ncbi:MAG: porin [Bacteroidetes bacterium]|nr:MAG: porin [Bacteroidota bacterium]